MSQDQNETKRKLRDAAEKAKATGLNREQRRALKKAGDPKHQAPAKDPKNGKVVVRRRVRLLPGSSRPMPYRANLDTPHDEGVQEKPKTKDEQEKGWDSPPPKTTWKKPQPKPE